MENEEKKKLKSIVVEFATWERLNNKIHHNGIRTMNQLISHLLDNLEKKDG